MAKFKIQKTNSSNLPTNLPARELGIHDEHLYFGDKDNKPIRLAELGDCGFVATASMDNNGNITILDILVDMDKDKLEGKAVLIVQGEGLGDIYKLGPINSGTITDYSYTGAAQTTQLTPGTYKLECWGANGGDAVILSTTELGAKGGYSVGTLTLTTQITMYLYTGGRGGNGVNNSSASNSTSTGAAGFNGAQSGSGGSGATINYACGGGGGASDIRVLVNDVYHRIIVAGGGSGSRLNYTRSSGNITSSPGSNGGGVGNITSYFGVAPSKNSYSAGGGGGWYCSDSNGGSGYVLTVDSDKPSNYFTEYTDYYLSNAYTVKLTESNYVTNPDTTGNGYVRITQLTTGYQQSTSILLGNIRGAQGQNGAPGAAGEDGQSAIMRTKVYQDTWLAVNDSKTSSNNGEWFNRVLTVDDIGGAGIGFNKYNNQTQAYFFEVTAVGTNVTWKVLSVAETTGATGSPGQDGSPGATGAPGAIHCTGALANHSTDTGLLPSYVVDGLTASQLTGRVMLITTSASGYVAGDLYVLGSYTLYNGNYYYSASTKLGNIRGAEGATGTDGTQWWVLSWAHGYYYAPNYAQMNVGDYIIQSNYPDGDTLDNTTYWYQGDVFQITIKPTSTTLNTGSLSSKLMNLRGPTGNGEVSLIFYGTSPISLTPTLTTSSSPGYYAAYSSNAPSYALTYNVTDTSIVGAFNRTPKVDDIFSLIWNNYYAIAKIKSVSGTPTQRSGTINIQCAFYTTITPSGNTTSGTYVYNNTVYVVDGSYSSKTLSDGGISSFSSVYTSAHNYSITSNFNTTYLYCIYTYPRVFKFVVDVNSLDYKYEIIPINSSSSTTTRSYHYLSSSWNNIPPLSVGDKIIYTCVAKSSTEFFWSREVYQKQS